MTQPQLLSTYCQPGAHKLLSPVPSATVFNKQMLNTFCVPTVCYPHRQNKAPRLSDLLNWRPRTQTYMLPKPMSSALASLPSPYENIY